MSDSSHDYYINNACTYAEGMVNELQKLQLNFNEAIAKVEKKYSGVLRARDRLRIAEKQILRTKEKALEKECKGLRAEVAELKLKLEQHERGRKVESSDRVPVAQATTLSIYDSIIFAISNWSTDGQTAPDIELACQSILFPCIYQKVMEGLEDYYFDVVPTSALLVVQRGREYVRYLRSIEDQFITDDIRWHQYAPMIQEWWINDGLPILYGARDDDWEKVVPKTLDEMIVWRDQPASRAFEFPLIWDGMELVKSHSDAIREHSDLPEFNKQQITTRLDS